MDEALIRLQEEELQRTGRYYKHICFLCVPLLCVSCYLYGLRPLLLCGFAVLMGNLCDRLISLLRRRVYQAGDYSNESFALVITLLMPATVDWYVLAAAILAGALIGKEVFGGYGSYPFHPAAVGYAVADGFHLVQRADDAVLRVGEGVEHEFDARRVVGNRTVQLERLFADGFMDKVAFRQADTFHDAFCEQCARCGFHVDHLILDRRAAAVQYQNYHFSL